MIYFTYTNEGKSDMKRHILTMIMVIVFFSITGCSKEGWEEQTTQGNKVESQKETVQSKQKEGDSNSYNNMKWGDKVFVEGIADNVTIKRENMNFTEFTLKQANGVSWHISVSDNYIIKENELDNETIRVYGKYVGEDKNNMLGILLNDDYARLTKKDSLGEYQTVWAFSEQNQNSQEESAESSTSDNIDIPVEDVSNATPFFSYTGKGDDVVSAFTSPKKLSYAHIKHGGNGHFAVKAHHNDSYDLLVNTTNPYDGKTLIIPNKEYTFEVNARGDWSIDIYEIGNSLTDSFEGTGDFVTPFFYGTSETYEISSTGSGHFSVKGWTDKGYDLLVNTTDANYSGKVLLKGSSKGGFFEINSSREWSIKPVK